MKVQLPLELYEKVQRAAKANGCSMNAEILARLEQSLMADRMRPVLALNEADQEKVVKMLKEAISLLKEDAR